MQCLNSRGRVERPLLHMAFDGTNDNGKVSLGGNCVADLREGGLIERDRCANNRIDSMLVNGGEQKGFELVAVETVARTPIDPHVIARTVFAGNRKVAGQLRTTN